MDKKALITKISSYKWYHKIKVFEDIYTYIHPHTYEYPLGGNPRIWDFILQNMGKIDFKDKRVLDIGCRDGLFSFEAERRGAREVIGIDNCLSRGATEFLIPFFRSKVKMYELNLCDLSPEKFGTFDIILFFGVLYHLRYPFWGLRKAIDCLVNGGSLLIESVMLYDNKIKNKDFLYCPVEESPFEPSSCSFFNQKGLSTTMQSLYCTLSDYETLPHPNYIRDITGRLIKKIRFPKKQVFIINYMKRVLTERNMRRQFFIYKKDTSLNNDPLLEDLWNKTYKCNFY